MRAHALRRVLEAGVGLVERERSDHRAVAADFRVAHRDLAVEALVRGDAGRRVGEVELHHVAREEDAPVGEVQNGVAVEVPAGVEQGCAGGEFQAFVVGSIDAQGVGPGQVRPLDGDGFRGEAVLDLPRAAVGVRVRRRQPAHATTCRDLREGGGGVVGRVFKEEVAAGQREQVAARPDAEGGFAAKDEDAVLVLVPSGDDALGGLRGGPELETVFRRGVAKIQADGAGRRGTGGALPEAAVGTNVRGQGGLKI